MNNKVYHALEADYLKNNFATKLRFGSIFGSKQDQDKNQTQKRKRNKGSVKEFIGKLSKGLMLPIAVLPIAGIFLGVGSLINTQADSEGLKIFGNFLLTPGNAIFGALPVLFAIAIAIAFTGDAGPAALSCLVGYLVFGAIQSALSTEVTYVDEYGATQTLGYNLLFYKGAALGSISPSIPDSATGETVTAGLPTSLFGTVIGINQLQSSVFGGFIVGFLVAFLYNRYKNIKLPTVLGFFNGIRFVPIISFLVMFPVTIVFLIFWPLIGVLLALIGTFLGNAIGFNSFVFGYIERALVPFGLHHAFYSPLWYSSAGGSIDMSADAIIYFKGQAYYVTTGTSSMSWNALVEALTGNISGTTDNPTSVSGDATMWAFLNANLVGQKVDLIAVEGNYSATNGLWTITSSADSVSIYEHTLTWTDLTSGQAALGTKGANGFNGVNIGQYLQGKYTFMIFGLPAAAIAMVYAAPKENRKIAMSICISAGFTSFLTGITEPIEFTFLFLAPWLFWGIHAFFCALSFGIMNWVGLIAAAAGSPGLAPHIGMSFSGGILDWIIFGAVQLPYNSNAWWSLLFGLVYAPIYFFLFYWLIKKFNIATPGRGDNVQLFTKADYLAKKAGDNTGANQVPANLDKNKIWALNVVNAYGGFDNIKNVDACITKLRIQVNDQDSVDTNKLVSLGARGTIKPSAQSVYSVFGGDAIILKQDIQDLMKDIEKDPSLKDQYENAVKDDNQSNPTNSSPNQSQNAKDNQSNKANNNQNKEQSELEKETVIVYAPISGKIVDIAKVPDEVFSQNMVGVGVAIKPSANKLYSPITGKVSTVFHTKHAYTFASEKGTQVMVHVGIDALNLTDKDGKKIDPFTSYVNVGNELKAGKGFADVKLSDLKYAKSTITPIVVLNETLANRKIKYYKTDGQTIKAGEPIFKIYPEKN